jgi:hypothetical protein
VVRIELSIDNHHHVHLEHLSDQSLGNGFDRGDTVYVTPRHVIVFDAEKHAFHPVTLSRAPAPVA